MLFGLHKFVAHSVINRTGKKYFNEFENVTMMFGLS